MIFQYACLTSRSTHVSNAILTNGKVLDLNICLQDYQKQEMTGKRPYLNAGYTILPKEKPLLLTTEVKLIDPADL